MLGEEGLAEIRDTLDEAEAEAEWGKHDSRGFNAARRLLGEYRTLAAEVERLRAHEDDAALGAAVRRLEEAPWHGAGPGGPVLAYCFDETTDPCYWLNNGVAVEHCEHCHSESCIETVPNAPLGWAVTDIYYAEGIPNLTWHDTPDAAVQAAGLMMEGSDAE